VGRDDTAFAALGGHLNVLKCVREHGCPWDEWTCRQAATGGHLELLRWAREHDCPWNEVYVRALATAGGHAEILTWMDGLGNPGMRRPNATRSQCTGGGAIERSDDKFEMITITRVFLPSTGPHVDDIMMEIQIYSSSMNLLEFARARHDVHASWMMCTSVQLILELCRCASCVHILNTYRQLSPLVSPSCDPTPHPSCPPAALLYPDPPVPPNPPVSPPVPPATAAPLPTPGWTSPSVQRPPPDRHHHPTRSSAPAPPPSKGLADISRHVIQR